MNILPNALQNHIKTIFKKHGFIHSQSVLTVNGYTISDISFSVIGANVNFNFSLTLLLPFQTNYEKIQGLILDVVHSFGNAEGNSTEDIENDRRIIVLRLSQTCGLEE